MVQAVPVTIHIKIINLKFNASIVISLQYLHDAHIIKADIHLHIIALGEPWNKTWHKQSVYRKHKFVVFVDNPTWVRFFVRRTVLISHVSLIQITPNHL